MVSFLDVIFKNQSLLGQKSVQHLIKYDVIRLKFTINNNFLNHISYILFINNGTVRTRSHIAVMRFRASEFLDKIFKKLCPKIKWRGIPRDRAKSNATFPHSGNISQILYSIFLDILTKIGQNSIKIPLF